MKRIKKQQIGYFLHILIGIIFLFSHQQLVVIVAGRDNKKREKLLCAGYFLSYLKKRFPSVIFVLWMANNDFFCVCVKVNWIKIHWKDFFFSC